MARYMQFETADGPILVEVESEEIEDPGGVKKAGLKDLLRKQGEGVVAEAQKPFEAAVRDAVRQNVLALSEAVSGLPRSPDEIELTFGLKATGEFGNIAVGKVGGEVNFTVKLAWKGSGDGN